MSYDITRRQTKEARASERGRGDDAPTGSDRVDYRLQTVVTRRRYDLRLTTVT